MGVIGSVGNGLGNLISGGTWAQSGAEIARQDWNAEQAEIARNFSALEAEKARVFSASEAQKNRDYQTTMSNTSYQRAVADLKKAGLNPALLYSISGASTPSGATAQSHSAQSYSASGSTADNRSSDSNVGKNAIEHTLTALGLALKYFLK